MTGPGTSASQFYFRGGTMHPEAASYIERRADSELLQALRNGELCHVLASRQMGKSSLMASTARRLASEGVQCALVDLTQFSEKNGSADAWYYALLSFVADKLDIECDLNSWWQENARLPALGRLTRFLDKVVLTECPGQIAIFVDEIDSTISLPFSDDFFAAIRACHNLRATEERFRRLTFVLLGVATPAQLIRDQSRTPFNVGRGVELTDFTPNEATPLATGLHADSARGSQLLSRILHWTDGHPYLTQTLCWHLVRNATWEIDELVNEVFFTSRAVSEESNLRLVRERLTQGAVDLASVLNLYRAVVTGQPVRDEPNSPVQASLRLAGVVKTGPGGELRVRNRIYERVFSAEWVAAELKSRQPRPPATRQGLSDAYSTFDALRKQPRFRPQAPGVLAEMCELQGLRDEALLVRIQALGENASDECRRRAASLVGEDYRNLAASFVPRTPLAAAALSPDGTMVLTASRDGTARLWSTGSAEPLFPGWRHRAAVTVVAFSPDAKLAATGSDDATALVWQVKDGKRVATFGHQARVRWLGFSGDGKRLVTTGSDGAANVWDIASGESVASMQHQASVRRAALSPDGTFLVTVSEDNTAIVWPLSLGGRFGTALPHEDNVTLISFAPSGSEFVTAGLDGCARIWDVRSGELVRTFRHSEPVLDLDVSPDGSLFVTGSADGAARVWEWGRTEQPVATLYHHHNVLSTRFTPDGGRVLTASADRTMRVWSLPDGRPLGRGYRHYGKAFFVCASPDGMKALTCDQEGPARLWRIPAEPSQANVARPSPTGARIRCAAFSDDGTEIVTGCEDNVVRVWPAGDDGTVRQTLTHAEPISAVAASKTANAVATGCEDGSLRIWDATTGRLLGVHQIDDCPIRVLCFSLDGRRIAAGGDGPSVRVWETVGAGEPRIFEQGGWVRSIAFDSDGSRLLTCSTDRSALIWGVDSGEEIAVLEHSSSISAGIFRPGDERCVLTSAGKSVFLWRTEDGRDPSAAVNLAFSELVQQVAFSPRGDHLLVVTGLWAFYYRLEEPGPVPVSCQLLSDPHVATIHWQDDAARVDLCMLDSGNQLRIDRLSLDTPDTTPLAGKPEELLSEWQWRLGLHIDADYRVQPSY